jgi:hypothetical protein
MLTLRRLGCFSVARAPIDPSRHASPRVCGRRRQRVVRSRWHRLGGDNWIETQNTLTECTAYVILVGASGVRRSVKPELHIATRGHLENDLPVFRGRRVRMRV